MHCLSRFQVHRRTPPGCAGGPRAIATRSSRPYEPRSLRMPEAIGSRPLRPARIAANEALLGLVFGLIGVAGHLFGAAQRAMFALFVGTAVLYVLIFVRVWRSVGEKPHSDSDRPADDDHRPAIPPSIPGGTV